MSTNLTDVDEFTSPVVAPEDNELANAESLIDGLQPLANRTRNLKNRLDTIATASFEVDGSDLTPLSKLTLAAAQAFGSSFTLSSNEVQVPNAGIYDVRAELMLVIPVSGSLFLIEIHVGSSKLNTGAVGTSADGEIRSLAFSSLVEITDPATQKISLRVASASSNVTIYAASVAHSLLTITKLSR